MRRPLKNTALASILIAGALLAVAVTTEAQQQAKIPKIGFLAARPSSGPASGPGAYSFRQELSKLGYVERKNIVFESRSADNKLDRLPALWLMIWSVCKLTYFLRRELTKP